MEFGSVTVACKVSGGNLPSTFSQTFNLSIDFRGCSVEQVLQWAAADRKIAFQRIRDYGSVEFIKSMAGGFKIHASQCGTKIKGREDKIADLVKSGWDKAVAEMYVDDPVTFRELMNKTAQQMKP